MSNASILTTGLILGLALVGCNGNNSSEFAERFVAACGTSTNMPQPICDCLAGRAEEELGDGARELLVAMLEQDEEAVAEMRTEIPMADAMQAGMFMTEAGTCASDALPPSSN